MIGDDINNKFEFVVVCSFDQVFEFLKPFGRVCGQVGVDIVVVFNRIGGTGSAFYDIRIVVGNVEGRIIADDCMMRYTGIPDMCYPEIADGLQSSVCKVAEFPNPILFDGAPGLIGSIGIAKQAGEYLVDNDFSLVSV